jgi:tripartite-type tricarboxylate transporter receptor subunit TctC
MMADVNMLSVPYRSGPPALTDLIGGHVHAMIDTLPSSIAYIKAGKLRALAVVAPARSEMLPDVPMITDFIPGYDASALFGIGVPKNTATEIVDSLHKQINLVLAEPELTAQFVSIGQTVRLSSAEYRKLIIEEIERWAKVVKFSGAKPN